MILIKKNSDGKNSNEENFSEKIKYRKFNFPKHKKFFRALQDPS